MAGLKPGIFTRILTGRAFSPGFRLPAGSATPRGRACGRSLAQCFDRRFEPYRNEMVFERTSLSCYCCEPFTALVNQSLGGIGLAGFAGESACLSTSIDAFHRNHRNHKVTYLSDASASRALDEMSADDVHRAVSKIIGNPWRRV